MTAGKFRQLALGFPGATESAHGEHPDFRIDGKIFATLGYPDEKWGMVKLTPAQQRAFKRKAPSIFDPAKGAWGIRGSTLVRLSLATETLLLEALTTAWQYRSTK
jgi:hypothetical protein